MARQQPPKWAIATATLCPCVAAVMLFFGLYGGMVCALLSSMAIVLGSSWRIAAVPAVIVALYGVYESAWVLRELYPWTEPYKDWTSHETYTTIALALVLGVLCVLLVISAMIAGLRAPIYKQRAAPQKKRNPADSPQQQIIVTDYHPKQESPRQNSPRLNSPKKQAPTPQDQTVKVATPSPVGARPAPQLQAPVTVVQRTPSGNIYTNTGVVLPSGEIYTEIRSGKPQGPAPLQHQVGPITYAVPAPAMTTAPVMHAPMQAQAPMQMPMQPPQQQQMMQQQMPMMQQPQQQMPVMQQPQQQMPVMQQPQQQMPVMQQPQQQAGAHVQVTVTPQ